MNLDPDQSREVVSLRPGVAAVFADGMDRPLRIRVPWGEDREAKMPSPPPPISGRRSDACGTECKSGRACTLRELREAELLASAAEQAWLRLWVDTLVLAHVVNRPLPSVPRSWAGPGHGCSPAARVHARDGTRPQRRPTRPRPAHRLRPRRPHVTVARVAQQLLGGAALDCEPPGPAFVLPQLRWLHELDRLFPMGVPEPDAHAVAPPLDYVLPGLRQQAADAKMGQRLRSLRRHPLSMDLPPTAPSPSPPSWASPSRSSKTTSKRSP
jgi:hypothetical protein